jgi:hypothetical protein
VRGTNAKLISPSINRSASPGATRLNLAETERSVSGSRKICQPVALAIFFSKTGSFSDFRSALTWLVLVFQISESVARHGAGSWANAARQTKQRDLIKNGLMLWSSLRLIAESQLQRQSAECKVSWMQLHARFKGNTHSMDTLDVDFLQIIHSKLKQRRISVELEIGLHGWRVGGPSLDLQLLQ